MTKKSVPRRKRSAPAHAAAPKKKKVVAAKKKHVRELVKAGLWGEIEKLYGTKILAKAKKYAETTQRVKKTPLEIAHEILAKNGYLPSQETAISTTSAPFMNMEKGTSTSEEIQRVDAHVQKNMSTLSSPKTLTKEQLNLIETRRQEALARRRRIQQAARAPVYSPVVIRPDSADHGLQSVIVPIQENHVSPPQDLRRTSSKSAGQPNSITHRVVTPEKTPTTNKVVETEHVRPQCFWDDLEAAAEIVQWENEQMAEVALEQLPATTATNVNQQFGTLQHEVRQLTEVETPNIQPPAVVSLSQELLAAADIIQWEKEHEVPGMLYNRFNCYDDEPTHASNFLSTQLSINKVTAQVAIMSSRLHNFSCCLCRSPTIVSSRTKNFLKRCVLMTTSYRTTSLKEAISSRSQMLIASAL
ncbi:hypothetical protein KXD40_001046 [Peronospora effusa]|nr:hypothetical protein KXD40_001046 [Peronospora effusa]